MSYEIWQKKKNFTHFRVMVFTQLKSYTIEASVNTTVLVEGSHWEWFVYMNGGKVDQLVILGVKLHRMVLFHMYTLC